MEFFRNQGKKAFARLQIILLLAAPPIFAQTIPVVTDPVDLPSTETRYRLDLDTNTTIPADRQGVNAALDSAEAKPPVVPFDAATMMRAEEVRPGMKGYGLTVFSGLEPERFDVDIIGVRHRMMAGTDIILCRIQSPNLKELGVIAGMSGSPVYVNDRLIGAVAYGFLDVDDPLAGVTPIDTMLRVYNATSTRPAQEAPASADTGNSSYEAYRTLRQHPSLDNLRKVALKLPGAAPLTMHAADLGAAADTYKLPAEFTLQPLASPVVLNSENPMTMQMAGILFDGMDIMSGARKMAAASDWSPSALAENSPGGPLSDLQAFSDKLSGGYALAVPYVEGDLNMAVVGTVTWRHKDRLVAFGHPMSQAGSIYAPMAAARINAIIRSRQKPFKLGEPVGHIGMIRQDRLPAVGGLFGQTARMFPFAVTIKDPNYAGNRTFNYRLWENRDMAPSLLMMTIIESLGAAAREGGDSTALYKYSIGLSDGTTVTAENYQSDMDGTIFPVMDIMADVGSLMNNPFQAVNVNGVSFEMEVTDRLRRATIESAVADRQIYKPGDAVELEWLVRPYRQDTAKMNYTFTLPADMPAGDYDISITDADGRSSLETRRNPGGNFIRSLDDLKAVIQRNYPANRVYVSLVDQDTGLSIRGSEMPKLPGSVINLVKDTVRGDYVAPVRGNYILDADLETRYQVSGSTSVKITVKPDLGS